MAARPPPKAAAAPSSMARPREDGSTKLDAAPRRIVVGPAHTNNNTNSGRSSVLPISTHEVVPAKEERRGLRPIHPSTAMSSRNPSVLSAYTPHVLHPQQQQRTEPRTSMSVNDEVEIEPLPPSMDRPDNASPRSISMPQCSSSSSQHVSCSTSPHAQRTSATTPSSHVIRRGPPPSRAGTSRRTPSLRDTLVQPTAPLYNNNSNNSFQNPSMSSHDEATYPDSPRSSDDGDAVVPMSIDEHLRDEESEDCHTAPMTAAREHAYAAAHGHVHGPSPLHPPPPSHTTTGAILPIRDDLIQRLSDVAGIHSSSVAASRRPSSRRRSGRHHQHIIPHTSAPRRSTSPPNNIGITTASSPTTTPTAKTTTTTTTPANITSSQSSAYRLPRILHHNNNNNNEGAPHHSHVASIDGRRDEPSSRSHTPGRRVPPEHTSYETRTTPHGKRIDQASRSTTTTTTISSSTRSEIDDGDDDDGLHRSTPTLTAHAVLPESIKPPPWSPVEALEYFGHCLTDYEHREIHGYTSIFYCASRAAALGSKSLSTPQPLPKHNKNVQHGDDHDDDGGADARFTDETGNYRIIIGDHIAFRYEVVDILGHGTFGIVLRVIDHAAVQESVHQRRTNNSSNGSSTNNKSPVFCALKIISANPLFTAAAAEEVQMLERLRPIFRHRTETEQRVACEWVSAASMDEHHVEGCTPPTAVSWQVAGGGLLNHFMFRQHRVLVFPLLGMDLSELLRVNGRRPLPMYVARSMCAQVARMISDIHACGVVHTDIKLDNVILVDRSAEDCSLPPLLSSSAREDGGEDRTSSSHRRISLGEFLNDESRLPSMIIPRTPPRVIPATVGLSSRELHLRIGSNSSSIDYPSVAQMHAEEQRQLQQQQHRHHHHQQQHRPPRHMKGGGTSSTFALHHHTAGAASIHYRPRSFGKAHQYASNNSNNGSSQKRGTHTTSRPTHVTNNLVLPTTPTSHSQRRGSLHTTTNTMELDGSFMQDAIAEDDLSVSSRVVVMDFGNAKMERAPPMFPVQSPFYRAPEAALKLPYDRAIDVWSLGCVLVELVCGQPLFQATGDVGLLQRHLDVLGLPDRPFLEHIKSTWRNYRDEHTYLKRLRHLRTNGTTTVGGVEDAEEAEADAQLASRSDEVKETEECWLSLLEMLSVKASQWRGDRTNNNNNNTTSPSLLELLRIDQAFLQRVAMRCRMSTSAHGSPSGLDHASMRLDELSRRVGSPDRGRRGEAEESLWLLMLDFVLGCLWWSPSERITADEATHHPFLSIFFFGNNNNNNTKKKKKVHDDDDVAMRSSSTRTSGFFFLTHHPLTAHWPALAEVAAEVVQLQGQLMQCGAQHMLNVEDETLSSIINIALAVFPLQQYPHTLEEALHLRIPHNNTMDHMLLSYGGVGGGSVGSSPRRPLSNETDGDAFLDLIGGVASLSGTVVVPTTATTTTMSGANNNNTNSNTPRGVASERPWRLGEASLYSANSSFLQLTNALEPPIRVSSSRSNLSMHYALNSIIPQQQQQSSASPSSRNNNNGATPTTATTPGSGAEGLSFFFSDPTNHI